MTDPFTPGRSMTFGDTGYEFHAARRGWLTWRDTSLFVAHRLNGQHLNAARAVFDAAPAEFRMVAIQ